MLTRRALIGSTAVLAAGCSFLESRFSTPSLPKETPLTWAVTDWFSTMSGPYMLGRSEEDFKWAHRMFTSEKENPFAPTRGGYTLALNHKERFADLDEFVTWLQEVEADLVTVRPQAARELGKRGFLLPLGQSGGEDESALKQEFYPVVLDQFREQGTLYALPIGALPLLMRFDPQYFSTEGVPPVDGSWNWGDLEKHARKLTRHDEDGAVERWGLAAHHVGLWWAVWQNEAEVVDSASLQCRLQEPATMEALDFVRGLLHTQRVSPPALYRDLWSVLDSPRPPAMIYDLFHGQRFPESYRWVELPRGKVQATPVYADLGIAITAKTKNSEVAYAALKGLIGAMQQYVVKMPAKREAVARLGDTQKDLQPEEIAAIQRTMEYGRSEPQYLPARRALSRILEALVRGDEVLTAVNNSCKLLRENQ